jgi:hypothetical protein
MFPHINKIPKKTHSCVKPRFFGWWAIAKKVKRNSKEMSYVVTFNIRVGAPLSNQWQ